MIRHRKQIKERELQKEMISLYLYVTTYQEIEILLVQEEARTFSPRKLIEELMAVYSIIPSLSSLFHLKNKQHSFELHTVIVFSVN